MHPGVVSTPLWRNTGGCFSGLLRLISTSALFGVKNPEQVRAAGPVRNHAGAPRLSLFELSCRGTIFFRILFRDSS